MAFEDLERLEASSSFKKFKKLHPKAFFCAAFFVFDYETGENKKQLDYFISSDHIETFFLEEKIDHRKVELVKKEKLSAIKKDSLHISVEQAIEIAKESIKSKSKNNSQNQSKSQNIKFAKIIAVLQTFQEKTIWNLSCISGLNVFRFHISAENGKVLKQEKINLMDMMRFESKKPDYVQ